MGKPHHNLEVWKRSLNFVTKIYKINDHWATELFKTFEIIFKTCHLSLFTRNSPLFNYK
jgi:hypothetical protein